MTSGALFDVSGLLFSLCNILYVLYFQHKIMFLVVVSLEGDEFLTLVLPLN